MLYIALTDVSSLSLILYPRCIHRAFQMANLQPLSSQVSVKMVERLVVLRSVFVVFFLGVI